MTILSVSPLLTRCHFLTSQFRAYKDIWKLDENKYECRKLLLLINHKTNLEWNSLVSRTAGRSLILTVPTQSWSKSMIMYANDLAEVFSVEFCMHAVRTYFTRHR